MENCSLALRIPARGSADGAMEMAHIVGSTTIDVWSLAVNAKVDLLKLSYNELPRRIAKVGRFTARYNATEQLPCFACESGTYYAFLFTCPEGARKEDCWVDVTSTKEELVGECHARIASSFVALMRARQNCRSIFGTTSDDLRPAGNAQILFCNLVIVA
jgi:hypothetical protein